MLRTLQVSILTISVLLATSSAAKADVIRATFRGSVINAASAGPYAGATIGSPFTLTVAMELPALFAGTYDLSPAMFSFNLSGTTGGASLDGPAIAQFGFTTQLTVGLTLSNGAALSGGLSSSVNLFSSNNPLDELGTYDLSGFFSTSGRRLILSPSMSPPNSQVILLIDEVSLALVGCDTNGTPALCTGDGGDQLGCVNCPCSNNAPAGTIGGCLNSGGTSTRIAVTGNPSVSLPPGDSTDLRFSATGAPALAFCILNSGDSVAPVSTANPCFGLSSGAQAMAFDGLRCAVLNTRRHGGRSADAGGDVGATNSPWGGEGGPPVGIAQAGGAFTAGQVRYFQIIHRDDPTLVCMRGLNTSQAVRVEFTP